MIFFLHVSKNLTNNANIIELTKLSYERMAIELEKILHILNFNGLEML